ncbi:MAG: hypothetical protein QM770_08390 [Tepidisphaeraceae bacterium]
MGQELTLSVTDGAQFSLILRLDGKTAANAAVEISEFSTSLAGLKRFMNAATELYFTAGDPKRRPASGDPLFIEVGAPRRGSLEAVIQVALVYGGMRVVDGVLGNRGDAAVVWAFGELKAWFRNVFRAHVDTKLNNEDKADLVRRLQHLIEDAKPPLAPTAEAESQQRLLRAPPTPDIDEPDEAAEEGDGAGFLDTLIAEMDLGLNEVATPVGRSCDTVQVAEVDRSNVITIGLNERNALARPFRIETPPADWFSVRVTFIRINKETGSCIFRFLDPAWAHHHRRGKIVDRRLRHPRDAYTQSFSLEQAMELWVRECTTDKGGRYFQLAIDRPELQSTMF